MSRILQMIPMIRVRRSAASIALAGALDLLAGAPGGSLRAADFRRGDANADGSVDLADAATILGFLFLGAAAPAAPGSRACGGDPTGDALSCDSFAPCAGSGGGSARVLAVSASGAPGAYRLSVTVRSPDTGCEQYADWWEVVSPSGELLLRRVLLHSHVGEQPFTRSGGPLDAAADTEIIVRAHMNTTGYGREAMRGTPAGRFEPVTLEPGFAADLAAREPLPGGCAF